MSKQEFLVQLRKGLSGVPQDDIEERLMFYGEMIEERMEEGLSEEEAVAAVGSVDEIVAQVIEDIPFVKIAKERMKTKRKRKVWEIILLALGSPIWLSLAIAAVAVIFAIYVAMWSIIVALWAIGASVAGCSLGGIVSAMIFSSQGNGLTGLAMLGASICCAGLSIFLFLGCKAVTKSILLLTKKMVLGMKSVFVGKEAAR